MGFRGSIPPQPGHHPGGLWIWMWSGESSDDDPGGGDRGGGDDRGCDHGGEIRPSLDSNFS